PPNDAQWMTQYPNSMLLGTMVLPGVHDAGMYTTTSCVLALPDFTITQTMNIFLQLQAGSRYFDLRPVLATGNLTNPTLGDFFHGHFGQLAAPVTSSGTPAPIDGGCLGDSMLSIISQVTSFLQQNPGETVILDFTHTQNAFQSLANTG